MTNVTENIWNAWEKASYRTRVENQTEIHFGISKYTETQLKNGVWNMWETTKKIPSLKNKEELDEVYIQQPDFELVEGLSWCDYKSDKVTDITPYMAKRSMVFGRPCIVIQEVDFDRILGAKIVTNDIELILWLDDFRRQPRKRVVNIDKKDIYDINHLEKHGVRFNSTIDKEELDKNGIMITGIDNYDNYVYEIYDSLRNTYKHQKRIDFIEADDKLGMFIEQWLDNHSLKNSIEDIIEFWDDELAYEIKWDYSYQHESPYDKNTYGNELYEGIMKQLCKKYEVPLTIGWDMWKIITTRKMKEVLTSIDQRYEIFQQGGGE